MLSFIIFILDLFKGSGAFGVALSSYLLAQMALKRTFSEWFWRPTDVLHLPNHGHSLLQCRPLLFRRALDGHYTSFSDPEPSKPP